MSDPQAVHLRPTAPIAAAALLPGDPGRALALAQALLDRPRMCNHHRGLWGYTGTTREGRQLTVQATGLGGPSVALVLADLARLGVSRAVRIGTCAALADRVPLGSLLVARGAVAIEGSSTSLGAGGTVEADDELHRRMVGAGDGVLTPALVASVDVPPPLAEPDRDRRADAAAVEMGTATLFALGARLEVAVASGLVVARSAGGEELDDERLESASLELGALAVEALA